MDNKRRNFLTAVATSFAAATALRITQAQQKLVQHIPGIQQSGRSITADTVAEAEKLAAVEFTHAEREMVAETLPAQVKDFEERKGYSPPNGTGPACVFDPRLPGATFRPQQNAVTRSPPSGRPLPANDADIAFAPVTELSQWIRTGQLTSRRLTEIYLKRLKTIGPKLECVVTLTEDLARQQALVADEEIAAGKFRDVLHGIPWGAKDLLATDGILTTWGAGPYRDQMIASNAHCVDLLTNAGAVLVAKLTLGALAYGDVWFGGKTRNPWNTDEGSRGSSAGPAAATVAGLVGFAMGSETLGSIVGPSMRCGATGLRPSYGRVSRAGAMAVAWSLDKLGPICRSVEDTGHVLAAINGYDSADPGSLEIPFEFDAGANIDGLKLGYVPALFESKDVNEVERASLEAARNLGIDIVELELPTLPFDSLAHTILYTEAGAAFEELMLSGRDENFVGQGPANWPIMLRRWRFIPAIEYVQAQRIRRELMGAMHETFQKVDAILSPSRNPLLTLTNMTGHPSLTLRTGFIESRTRGNGPGNVPTNQLPAGRANVKHTVPHGITLWGRLFEEGRLLNLGLAIERVFDVSHRRPPIG